MIDKSSTDRNRLIDAVLIAVALVLLATSIFSVYSAWRTGLEQSRVETISRLMAIQTAPRSTETPGINAWVSWSLLNNPSGSVDETNRLRRLVTPQRDSRFPSEFRGLLDVLRQPPPAAAETIEFPAHLELNEPQVETDLEFRKVGYLRIEDQLLVHTARSDPEYQNRLQEHASFAGQHLADIRVAWENNPQLPELNNLSRIISARVARFYVLDEDEALLSLPLGNTASRQDFNRLYLSEADEFRKNPRSPTFVSNTFFFDFTYEEPLDEQAMFSGMYLDLGGLGLIASVVKPVLYNEKRCVLGADIAFEIDWHAFAQNLSPNWRGHVVHLDNVETDYWNPWTEFHSASAKSPPKIKNTLHRLAEQESTAGSETARKSVYIATAPRGSEAMAIQVDRATWLLLLVGHDGIRLPWATMLLTGLVFGCLFWRMEFSRRKAVKAKTSAHREMQEKQNLLDTMQVPLMVVDPSTDEVVYCNRAAESIGMKQGVFFGKDIVAPDKTSQEQYRQTQTLEEEHRRAYGVPIRVQANPVSGDNEPQLRHAIVRSVAVTAPIESLLADERHRLGILFIVDEQIDLSLLMNQRLSDTRQDEKRRLSGLMNHGVDSLARVLRNQMVAGGVPEQISGKLDRRPVKNAGFATWLSSYLTQRIQLLSWTLENWGSQPAATEQRMIERENVLKTLEQFEHVFDVVAGNRKLREELHWNNGAIAGSNGGDSRNLIESNIDWDPDCVFTVPRDGVFGFFLGEALVNAIRHGKTGSAVRLTIEQNRNRNELLFRVDNEVTQDPRNRETEANKPFGGMQIMNELARLSGWMEPEYEAGNGRFCYRWTVPTILRKGRGTGD